ncbi:AraC family transcriptional regulator [Pedobacter nutrimenti]|uniref:helix-turn-helix domain-containing protein n=1 Tax=Pedobacter nutrimenti TaxID=1241337 RepID=UPI00292F23ED|nr:AraC family transcriptional regulator [Pedobacter nutrimenti]
MFANISPITSKLKRYVSSFTISLKEGLFPVKYTAFPNIGNCLAFFNHTAFQIQSDEITFRRDETQCPVIILLGRLTSPTLVTYIEPIEEISINFTPCGINYFFGIPFLEMAQKCHQLLEEPKWTDFALALYSELPERRIAMLEAFLLSSLNEQKADAMERVFSSMAAMDKLKVQELADIACMSERNFLRYFRKYFGCNPSTYKKILRFRNVLDTQYSKQTNSYRRFLLTDDYCDTSHFRKEFLQFTGCTPRQFNKSSFLPGNGNSVFRLV